MSKEIKAIDGSTVHRICSGQVVLSLAIAVKELVENSIDAGAKNISVKLKDHGSKLVEVVDDGEGVDESNFAALTQKYHTSKLRQFSDLEDVATFGFRGEALSSLCALCDVTIATRHKDAAQATLLKYDHHGVITSKSPCARDRGTTVSLHNLFTTLPVRHREFLANLKREFGKMVTLLTGYCLVVTEVNISCVNFTEGGRKQVILNSQGSQAVRERIATVYGAKEAAKLLEIQQCAPTEDILEEFALTKYLAEAPSTRIEGYISSCAHGSGRSSADRQFVFVNSRPCEMPKLTKLVNSTYHTFNRDQYPFLLINIHLERHSVDVNVTPDKRSVFVHHEKYLLAIVKCSLLAMFRPVAATYERQSLSLSPALSQSQQSPMSSYLSPRLQNLIPADKGAFSTPVKRTSSALGTPTVKSSAGLQSFKFRRLESRSRLPFTPPSSDSSPSCSQSTVSANTQGSSTSESLEPLCSDEEVLLEDPAGLWSSPENIGSLRRRAKVSPDIGSLTPSGNTKCEMARHLWHCMIRQHKVHSAVKKGSQGQPQDLASSSAGQISVRVPHTLHRSSRSLHTTKLNGKETGTPGIRSLDRFRFGSCTKSTEDAVVQRTVCERVDKLSGTMEVESEGTAEDEGGDNLEENNSLCSVENEEKPQDDEVVEVDQQVGGHRQTKPLNISCKSLAQRISSAKWDSSNKPAAEKLSRGFRAAITPSDNAAAENELSRQISKDMFEEMKIIGQFNLGFIIAQLGEDLFIVDQHAADEKYNFEMLQRDVVMETQRLLMPQALELTAVNEMVLTENLEIFEKNGFGFEVDESLPLGQRVRLVSVPVSGSWQFGKEDVDELIFMLSDNPHTVCRPSKLRQMFASRACRKSVMVGTALTVLTMKKVVSHLGELHHPWNCPHGRPTMRHLINMSILPD
ncbi:LOW QUALITY PROTEIN: mismatch repair endonuclease PMS2-like [Dermacentor silvarum]|uniref:LOW QUALITY PROTEIN: mismatch repair endonuclease PMS2-like n=1 Tax=Dermacentor silvarum TaxID=543639 RepID=UPI002100855B|nr:LOW QUALITY PROTEIN: mismatch repair endonuclease PMS2-like [Dermacentor silvarum]